MQRIHALVESIRERTGPERAAAYFELMDLVFDEDWRYDAIRGVISLCQQNLLTPDDLLPYGEGVLAIWLPVFECVQSFQQKPLRVEWILSAEYEGPRSMAEWILDLLGYLPGEQVSHRLREALQLQDPRLKLFAALSLLRRSEQVGPQEIEAIAASDEMRDTLWDELQKLGREALMPSRWATPVALGASALTRWLAHPNELNAIPEELELMKVYPARDDDGSVAPVFLFRFREFPKPWEAGEGWMAGIAGPYRAGRASGSPWSAFKRWDSMSPDEHFEMLFGHRRKTSRSMVAWSTPEPTMGPTVGCYRYQTNSASGQVAMGTTAVIRQEPSGEWSVTYSGQATVGQMVDTSLLDRSKLTPLKRSGHYGPVSFNLDFSGSRVTGGLIKGGQEFPIAEDLLGDLFPEGPAGLHVLGCLPLAEGYVTAYRVFDMQSLRVLVIKARVSGSQMVEVPAGIFDAFEVEILVSDGGAGKATLWIDKNTRLPVKNSWWFAGDALSTEMVT